jgi:uncharacterized protein YegL
MSKLNQTSNSVSQQNDKNEKEIQKAIEILASRIEKASAAKDGKASDSNSTTVRRNILACN